MRKALLLGVGLAAVMVAAAGIVSPGWSQLLANSPWPKFQADLGNTGRLPDGFEGPPNMLLKWTYTAPSWIKTQVSVSADGFLYMGHSNKAVCKVDAATGNEEWCSGHGFANQSSPALGNGTGSNYRIYRGDRGNLFWSMDTSGTVTPPTPRPDSNIATPGWPFKVPYDGDTFSSMTLHPGDGTLSGGPDKATIYGLCGCLSKGLLYAFRPNGTQKWDLGPIQIANAGIRNSSPALVVEPTMTAIYVGSANGLINRIEDHGATRLVRWSKRPVTNAQMKNHSPSVENGILYISSTKGVTSYTADAAGTLRWHVLSGIGDFDTTPAIGRLDGSMRRWIYVSGYKLGKRKVYRIQDDIDNPSHVPTVEFLTEGPSGSTGGFAQSPSIVIDNIGRAYAGIGNKVVRIGTGGLVNGEFVADAQVIAVSLGDGVMYVNDRAAKLYAVGN